jgi:hypothetical protein
MKTGVLVRQTKTFMSTGCNTMLTHYPEVGSPNIWRVSLVHLYQQNFKNSLYLYAPYTLTDMLFSKKLPCQLVPARKCLVYLLHRILISQCENMKNTIIKCIHAKNKKSSCKLQSLQVTPYVCLQISCDEDVYAS